MNETVNIRCIKRLAISYPDSNLAGMLNKLPDEIPRIQLPGLVEVWTSIIDAEVEK